MEPLLDTNQRPPHREWGSLTNSAIEMPNTGDWDTDATSDGLLKAKQPSINFGKSSSFCFMHWAAWLMPWPMHLMHYPSTLHSPQWHSADDDWGTNANWLASTPSLFVFLLSYWPYGSGKLMRLVVTEWSFLEGKRASISRSELSWLTVDIGCTCCKGYLEPWILNTKFLIAYQNKSNNKIGVDVCFDLKHARLVSGDMYSMICIKATQQGIGGHWQSYPKPSYRILDVVMWNQGQCWNREMTRSCCHPYVSTQATM